MNAAAPSKPVPMRTAAEVAALLSQSLGNEKAAALVGAAVEKLGLDERGISTDDALAVLEVIAAEPGVAGITARFAKSRVHLAWSRVD